MPTQLKDISTLPADIGDVLTNNEDHRHTTIEDATVFAERLLYPFDKAVGNETKERKDKVIYASEIGRPCHRQLWYAYHQPDKAEPIDAKARYKFLYGDVLEELTLELARLAGHNVEMEQQEFELELEDGWKVRGRCDAVIDGVLVDVKSASSFAFNKYTSQGLTDDTDSFGYRDQLMFYTMTGIQKGLLHNNQAFFLFVEKNTGEIKLVPQQSGYLPSNTSAKIATKIAAVNMDKASDIVRMPTKPSGNSGNEGLDTTCRYCPFKQTCWDGKLRAFQYSNGVSYLTRVAREPKVPEIDLS